ncbi:MAG: polyprenyl synthetase family protein [Firmicutes bacterium]|nr:polyprenyl synthetase family protein [Bacillota bacterium]
MMAEASAARAEEYLADVARQVEARLDQALPAESEDPATLHASMRYSTLGGGKRLRAALVLASCRALGGPPEAALAVACAVEMIHAYSLIHDDLPCMDNGQLRRGKPTNHRVFGDAVATLAGDALLTLAFEELASIPLGLGVTAQTVVQVVAEISRAAGSRGMVGGQVADLQAEGRDIDLERLRAIHRRKTGALILACVRSGALLACAGAAALKMMDEYGRHLGLAYQIVDDILDETGDQAVVGKGTHTDLLRGKATYPRLVGLEESRRLAREAVLAAQNALEPLGEDARPLLDLAAYVARRDR